MTSIIPELMMEIGELPAVEALIPWDTLADVVMSPLLLMRMALLALALMPMADSPFVAMSPLL